MLKRDHAVRETCKTRTCWRLDFQKRRFREEFRVVLDGGEREGKLEFTLVFAASAVFSDEFNSPFKHAFFFFFTAQFGCLKGIGCGWNLSTFSCLLVLHSLDILRVSKLFFVSLITTRELKGTKTSFDTHHVNNTFCF